MTTHRHRRVRPVLRAARHRRRAHALDGDGETSAPATVVVFTCNHCPYALAWHDRLLAVARDYADRGVRMLLINSNDAERYPRDSFEAMRERVARRRRLAGAVPARRGPVGRPRLRRADDARRLRRRRPTARSPTAARRTPTTATPASTPRGCARRSTTCSTGRPVDRAETKPVGCSIKWKP